MSLWIQVYTNLAQHRKICKLRDGLALKGNYEAVGMMVCLWCWAAVNAADGSLAGFSERDVAEATGWKKSPGKLVQALESAGFLDRDEAGCLVLHDWDEHNGMLQDSIEEQKRKTRDRVRRHREKKKLQDDTQSNNHVTVTGNACNAPTIPNLTIPNQLYTEDVAVSNVSYGPEPDAAATAIDKLEYVGGTLGQGVVMLTEAQEADLLDRIGLDGYNCYVKKLSDFILRTGANPKNHYETILKWYTEDTAIR